MVFTDKDYVILYDKFHSEDEERFRVIGKTSLWLLFVIFVEKIHNEIKIISARKAVKKEKRIYEEKNRL